MFGANAKEETSVRRSLRRRATTASEQPALGVGCKVRGVRSRRTCAPRVMKQKYKWLLDMVSNETAESDSNDSESVVDSSQSFSDDDADIDVRQQPYSLTRRHSYPDVDVEENAVEKLVLPPSCDDLMIDTELSLLATGVYEGLRCFLKPLRLSPFRFEDFCAAVSSSEDSKLLDEIHICLLRVLFRADEVSGTVFAAYEAKDSVAITMWCGMFDSLSWYEIIRQYLASFSHLAELNSVVMTLGHCSHYFELTVHDRLTVLQTLVDLFLQTESARDFMATFGSEILHEDQCRYCHKVGDLLCCETCPAVYHLVCLDPPLAEVPTGTWLCPICSKHQVKGVTDCLSDFEQCGFLVRHEPLGYDRHGQRYWFLCRRIFVELAVEKVAYYSSVIQFDALCVALSASNEYMCEVELLQALTDVRDNVVEHMRITAELTDKLRGSKKSAIVIHDEKLQKLKQDSEAGDNVQDFPESAEPCSLIEGNDMDHLSVDADEVHNEHSVNEGTDADEPVDELQNDRADAEKEVDKCDNSRNGDDGQDVDVTDKSHLSRTDGKCLVLSEHDADMCVNSDPLHSSTVCKEMQSSNQQATDAVNQHAHTLPDSDQSSPSVAGTDDSDTKTFPAKTGSMTSVHVTANSSNDVHLLNEFFSLLAKRVTRSMTGILSRKRYMCVKERIHSSQISSNNSACSSVYKLGMDGHWRRYVNLYRTNPLALSKQQSAEERDKRRFLSYKFSIATLSVHEFSWKASIYGEGSARVEALRQEFLRLESFLPAAFLHSAWKSHSHSQRWMRVVRLCASPREFALALSILVACMKHVVFRNIWHDAVGHTSLCRVTSSDKEELKKKEKELRRFRFIDDSVLLTTHVHYTLGLHHQVWKQRGEEYRLYGGGGWYWCSATRVCRYQSYQPRHSLPSSAAAVDKALESYADDSSVSSQPFVDVCPAETEAKSSKLSCLLKRRLQLSATENEIKVAVQDIVGKYKARERTIVETAECNAVTKYCCYSTSCLSRESARAVATSCYSPVCSYTREQAFSYKVCVPNILGHHLRNLSGVVPREHQSINSKSSSDQTNASEPRPRLDSTSPTVVDAGFNKCSDVDHEVGEGQTDDSVSSEGRAELHDSTEELRILTSLVQTHTHNGCVQLTPSLVSRLHTLLETDSDTRNQVHLRGAGYKPGRKKAEIPVAHNFRTPSHRQSIFVLAPTSLRHLARSGGMLLTIPGFASTVSSKTDSGWRYFGPRPLFSTAWQYRTLSARNLSAVALQLRVLWCCIRWDDMSDDSSAPEDVNVASEADTVTTTTILRRRDVGHDGLHSEYLVRRVSAPVAADDDWHEELRERQLPQRAGLRERRATDVSRLTRPTVTETWVAEEELNLSEIKQFFERSERPVRQRIPTKIFTPEWTKGVRGSRQNNCWSSKRALKVSAVQRKRRQDRSVKQTGSLLQNRTALSLNHLKPANSSILQSVQSVGTPHQSGPKSYLKSNTFVVSRNNLSRQSSALGSPQKRPCLEIRQSLRVVTDPSGKLTVSGLRPDQQLVTLPDGHIKIISKGSNQQHSEMDTATASLPSSAVNIVHLNETVSFPRGASLQNSDGAGMNESPHNGLHTKRKLNNDDKKSEPTDVKRHRYSAQQAVNAIMSELDEEETDSGSSSSSIGTDIDDNDDDDSMPRLSPVSDIASLPVCLPSSSRVSASETCADSVSLPSSSAVDAKSSVADVGSLRLYCVCQTPYDKTKFYVGCNVCLEWFHGTCVGISANDVRNLSSYVCHSCRSSCTETETAELHCICQTPYDESKLYIGCDTCSRWFHGSCVGVNASDIKLMTAYICSECRNHNTLSTRLTVDNKCWAESSRVLKHLEDLIPSGNDFIALDFSHVRLQLAKRKYAHLSTLIHDVMQVFSKAQARTIARDQVKQLEQWFLSQMKCVQKLQN